MPSGYTTAVTDWVATDYFNVADWTRIYRNTEIVVGLAEVELSTSIGFEKTIQPGTATMPDTIDFNALLGSIERLRAAVVSVIPFLTTTIKHDWIAGINKPVFNYLHVNLWESTVDVVWGHYDGTDLDVCPTLTGDLTIPTGTHEVYIGCVDTDIYSVILEGTGKLYVL